MNTQSALNLNRIIKYKVGFIGFGNLAHSLAKGWIEKGVLAKEQIFASNRSQGKLAKAKSDLGIQTFGTNEEVIDTCDVLILSMKPQDLRDAVEPLVSSFRPEQLVISLAAGIYLRDLEKKAPHARWAKVLTNTPVSVHHGVVGYLVSQPDQAREILIEDLFSPLGRVFSMDNEEQMEALLVSCSSGTGFVMELMMYFQDWIEERGISPEVARAMVVETFLGSALLASQAAKVPLDELQSRVVSKKGTTAAGLESMTDTELERGLRISFEKAALRNQELSRLV